MSKTYAGSFKFFWLISFLAFLSQIRLTTGEKSFDQNISHFCVIYPLCIQCVNAFIIFPELPLVGLNLILCKQCQCHLLIGAAVNHLHSVLVAKLISISLRGCVDSLFGFQLWSNCSQLALSLCLYFRPWPYVATTPFSYIIQIATLKEFCCQMSLSVSTFLKLTSISLTLILCLNLCQFSALCAAFGCHILP